jgi:2Fe-2S ferredoxin
MPNTVKITFVEPRGSEKTVDASIGTSLMEAAIHHRIAGILGECGGACACATCHIYLSSHWMSVAGEPTDTEKGLLEMVIDPTKESRLACQVMIDATMNGLVARIPENQV